MPIANAFPYSIPGMTVEIVAAPEYSTNIGKSVSQKEVRWSWATSEIVTYRINFSGLRTAVAAPSPWGSYNEVSVVRYFHATSKGSWDYWYLNNSTSVFDPSHTSNIKVRFASDRIEFNRVVPNVYAVTFDAILVL